jgi:flagellar protein FlaI
MNIPRSLIAMIDAMVIQGRTEVNGKPARRVLSVAEIVGLDPQSKDVLTNPAYNWEARTDSFTYSGRSYVLQRAMQKTGANEQEVQTELQRRKTVLEWMVKNKIRRYTDVAGIIREYYVDPARVYRKARVGVQ